MVDMDRVCAAVHGLKPAMLMVLVQAAFAAVNVLYKLAADDGMNLTVIVAYRFIFAAAFFVPLALVAERKNRPKLTWKIVMQGFFCGLFGGSLAQNLYIQALSLTSATFASAMNNLIPAITFVLAICFRMETLAWGTWPGKAKVIGTLISIGGAMLLTFYKGVEINIWSTQVNLLHHPHASSHSHSTSHQLYGALLALGCCFCYAIWLIIQTKMSAAYPCQYSCTALIAFTAAIQASVFALMMERDFDQWKLGWNIRLLTSAFTGIVASGLAVTMIAWGVQMRGPLYVSIFNPLMLVLVAIAGSLLLDEKLHLGSIIGAVIIVVGLYVVLWGKGKELKKMTQLAPSSAVGVASTKVNNDDQDHDGIIETPSNILIIIGETTSPNSI